MDDGLNKEETKGQNMGASSNPNSAKIATLQERKKVIEETLAKHNQELRKLCIQEGELTGVMPIEYPLEQGETPPQFRRRIGTSFQLPPNLLNNLNNDEEDITALELELWNVAKMAEAALGLANENNGNKTVRRTHMADYQKHKQRYNALQEILKSRHLMNQQPKQPSPIINQVSKQRKKPRPLDQDDAISMNANQVGNFGKNSFRHSSRSLQYTSSSSTVDAKYSNQSHSRLAHRSSDSTSLNENMTQYQYQEDPIPSFYYSLNINGYQEYSERQANIETSTGLNQYAHFQSANNLHKPQAPCINPSHTLPHVRRSPQSIISYSNHNLQEYHKTNPALSTTLHRQTSPSTSSGSSVIYYPTQQLNYRTYNNEHRNINLHQIQPHQQYEHDVMSSSGLGGFWKRSENGDMFWCNSNSDTSNAAYTDSKKCGSLDRRKNKRMHKHLPQNVDSKSATLGAVPVYHETARVLPKAQQVVHRHRQDNRQLVRTQSLGSVGGHVDSVCPSDDSSIGSETLSYNENSNSIRKSKQKEWYETSLDGPTASVPSPSRSHSTVPSIAPEDKYVDYSSPSPHTPLQMSYSMPTTTQQYPSIQKPALEIPAESKPSIRSPEINLEIFNNNIPKNGTVIQHAQWKPYHEETKSFEMSDFYKYSTKFNKTSPQKVTPAPEEMHTYSRPQSIGFRKLLSPQGNDNYVEDDNAMVVQKGTYKVESQPFSPVNIGSPLSVNTSLDLSQLAPNVAENFSAEMNAWFQNHEHQTDNNNATLV